MTRPLSLAAAIIVFAAGCTPAALTNAEVAAEGSATDAITLTRLRAEPYSLTYSSGLRAPELLVVRDANAWRQTWTRIWDSTNPTPALPDVDFAREIVIVAALGERSSGGYSILIDSATVSGAEVLVWVRAVSPGANCGTTAALTQPVDAARLTRTERPIRFRQDAQVRSCD